VEQVARQRNTRYLGRQEEVLVEASNPKDPTQLMGRTRTNRLTFFAAQGPDGRRFQPGDLVTVTIESTRSFSLSGSPL
jgi:tRNA-2-methylthio-N6-dimethylallyladenosine synthase